MWGGGLLGRRARQALEMDVNHARVTLGETTVHYVQHGGGAEASTTRQGRPQSG
jgi:hypothetical protein